MSDITMGGVPGQAPGGPNANEGGSGGTGDPSTTDSMVSIILLYATLPLQIGPGVGAQAYAQIDWRQHATAPQLVLCLQDACGIPINLTGTQSVTLRLKPLVLLRDGVPIQAGMRVLYAAGGLVAHTFLEEEVRRPGRFGLEIEVVRGDDSLMYFPTTGDLLFVIHPSK